MGKVSIRFSDQEENLLRKKAETADITLTALVRNNLFSDVGRDEFHEFKILQITANQQMEHLLLELTRHIRLTENIMAMMYKQVNPEQGENMIQMIQNALNKEFEEMMKNGTA